MIEQSFFQKRFDFKFEAGTSRGILKHRDAWFVKLYDTETGSEGIGEAGPLVGLSVENFENLSHEIVKIQSSSFLVEEQINNTYLIKNFPSLNFAYEVALLGLKAKKEGILFDTSFTRGESEIPINGLIWMNEIDEMYAQAISKIEIGFACLKFKIGAKDFDQECNLLERIRKHPMAKNITIRLDANGAFEIDEAEKKLFALAKYNIHSIEQPIAPKNWDKMAQLCSSPIISIALDEELIGVCEEKEMRNLIKHICPQFVIIKPTLLGGFSQSINWIKIAEAQNIGWWLTSALESSIGLDAIAQFTSSLQYSGFQGLGTGAIYEKNFPTKLLLQKDKLHYIAEK